MPRQKRSVATYGRHRQRIVSVDPWSSDDSRKNPFNSCSSNYSNPYDLSFNQEDVVAPQRKAPSKKRRKQEQNKEAKENVTPVTLTSDNGGMFHSAETKPRRALADVNYAEREEDDLKVATKRTAKRKVLVKVKKQTRKDTGKTSKKNTQCLQPQEDVGIEPPKRVVTRHQEKMVNSKSWDLSQSSESSHHDNNSMFNFSQFDKYSLIISDTAEAEDVIGTPSAMDLPSPRKTNLTGKTSAVALTSTPQVNNCGASQHRLCHSIHGQELSLIGDDRAEDSIQALGVGANLEATGDEDLSHSLAQLSLGVERLAAECDVALPALRTRRPNQHKGRVTHSQDTLHKALVDCFVPLLINDASRSLFEQSYTSQTSGAAATECHTDLPGADSVEQDAGGGREEQEAEDSDEDDDGLSDLEELSDILEEADQDSVASLEDSNHGPRVSRTKYESCDHVIGDVIGETADAKVREFPDGSSYHTCDSEVPDECLPEDSPVNRLLLRNDLNISCRSMRDMLTPVRLRPSGVLVSSRDNVLLQCGQTKPMTFAECIPPRMRKDFVKIGEGVYGEVYRAVRIGTSVALKVIPVEGSQLVNDEKQKSFEEILSEIVISKELSGLRDSDVCFTENFVEVQGVSLVKGCYPDFLLKQWDLYHKRKRSENDRPDAFPKDQFFLVFEFENAGQDLESVQLTTMLQARSILCQVTYSLAIAESALQFEHRDLHWGNVLVKGTDEEYISYTIDGHDLKLETHGVKVAVIDFTLSRLQKDGCSVYTDLAADPTLFENEGDYQFDIYRLMKMENGNEWRSFQPFTNVLWIHYLADKLVRGKTYAETGNKQHRNLSREFRNLLRDALDYTSALHLLSDCSFFQEQSL